MQRNLVVLAAAAAIFSVAVYDTGRVRPSAPTGEFNIAQSKQCKDGFRFDWRSKTCVKL
jgi:hypothetical protein